MKSLYFSLLLTLALSSSILYAQTPPTITSVVDPYTGGTKLAPGGRAVITGTNLGLGGLVTVGGVNAFNIVSPQFGPTMTIQIPWTAQLGTTVPVVITTGAGASPAFNIALVQYAPVLISTPSGSLTSPRHSNGVGVTSTTPATPTEQITFYAIGLGPTTTPVNTGALAPNNTDSTTTTPTVTFGANAAVNASVSRLANSQGFFGANAPSGLVGSTPALVGVFLVTTTIPAGTAPGPYLVSISIGGASSNSVSVAVGPAPTGPVISAIVGESGNTALCPGDVVILSGLNLGTNPTVTVGGKTAFSVAPPVTNGNEMTIQIPVDAPVGAANVTLAQGGQTSAAFPITLAQFAPALVPGGNGFPQLAGHQNNTGVTAANPAYPGEQIYLLAYGLGPTKPVVPTGSLGPSDVQAVTATVPAVSFGGFAATNVTAFLASCCNTNSVGIYLVQFTVPSNATTGNFQTSITIGGVTTGLVTIQVFSGPHVTNVTNAASNNSVGLPNSPIAQGSIFTVVGTNLGPANIAIADKAFQSTSLSGTSMTVTVAGTTVNPTLLYTVSNKVAALLPSNTPVGTGTVTVTYNGTVGLAAPITVVASNLGIFTVSSDGIGAGIVTYPDYSLVSPVKANNCGGPYTVCGAANPGDTLVLWATGLGPITGNDSAGDGLGVPMPNIPLTLWLGGVNASVGYQGRGCCIGEDQIVFTVPDNVPTGCAVSLTVQIGGLISNGTAIAVAPKGTRTCSIGDPAFTGPDLVTTLTNSTAQFSLNQLTLNHDQNIDNTGKVTGTNDNGRIDSFGFTILPVIQPFAATYLDQSPPGTCQLVNRSQKLDIGNYFATGAEIDGGPSFNVTGPNGSQTILPNKNQATLSSTGAFLTPGTYTYSGTGGADYGSFSMQLAVGAPLSLTTPANGSNITVTRTNGVTLNWTGGSTASFVHITGSSSTDASGNVGGSFDCIVPATTTSFTVPPNVLMGLPAGAFGNIFVESNFEAAFTVNKLSLAVARERANSVIFVTWQ